MEHLQQPCLLLEQRVAEQLVLGGRADPDDEVLARRLRAVVEVGPEDDRLVRQPGAVGEHEIGDRRAREIEPAAQPLFEHLAGALEVAALVELHQTSVPLFGGVWRTSTSPFCLRRIVAQVPSPQESWSSPQAWIPLIR